MLSMTYAAMNYVRDKHCLQTRRYTLDPYFIHLAEVAAIIQTVAHQYSSYHTEEMITVAWCHDLIEDCGVSKVELNQRFGSVVAAGVELLSDLESGNRATRKQLARERLSAAPDWIQTIKLADLISNTPSIIKNDPKFAPTYMQEVTAYVDVLTKGHPGLRDTLVKILYAGK